MELKLKLNMLWIDSSGERSFVWRVSVLEPFDRSRSGMLTIVEVSLS